MNQEQIAEVLAGHQDWAYTKNLGYYRSKYKCQCGADFWAGDHEEDPSFHEALAAHQAAMLAPLFAAAQAEALREAVAIVASEEEEQWRRAAEYSPGAQIVAQRLQVVKKVIRARADNLTIDGVEL